MGILIKACAPLSLLIFFCAVSWGASPLEDDPLLVGRNKEVGDAFKKKRQPLAPPLQAEKKTDARERGTGGGKVPSNRFAAVLENPKDSVVIRKHRKENTDSENALKRRFSQLEKNEGLGLASGVGIGLDAAIFMILFNTPPSQLNVNHLFLAQAATFGVSTVVSLFFLKRDAEIAGFSCDVDASPGDPRVLPLADSRGTIHLLQMLQMIWTFSACVGMPLSLLACPESPPVRSFMGISFVQLALNFCLFVIRERFCNARTAAIRDRLQSE